MSIGSASREMARGLSRLPAKMTRKKLSVRPLHLMIIFAIAFLGLGIISFIQGSVGATIRGTSPWSIFAVHAPTYELAGEHIFGEGIPVTNTMLTSWISVLVLVGLFFASTRKMKLVPSGLQNFVEFVYEVVRDFINGIAGKELGPKFFPICTTIFLFVIANAWIALLPGFESIKMNGEPLLRNANTDINVPFMLALVSFFFTEYWAFKVKRASYLKRFFNFGPLNRGFKNFKRGVKAGLSGVAMGMVAVFASLIEIISEFMRIVAFTFRLFGNMTAGVLITMVIIYLVPLMLPSVCYALEAFLGFVQAMIFGGLTLAFLTVGVMSEEEELA